MTKPINSASAHEFWKWAHALTESDLPSYAKLVGLVIWLKMRPNALTAEAKKADLMLRSSLSDGQVKNAVRVLRERGFIDAPPVSGRGHATRFRATTPQQMLFDLEEVLSYKPKKRTQKRADNAPFVVSDIQEKGHISSEMGQNMPPYILPITTMTDDDASARGGSDDFRFDLSLRSRLIDAAGCSIVNPAESSHLASMARPRAWLNAGCDLDADVLPAIRRVAAKCSPGAVRSWQYFEAEVMAAKADRERPPEIPRSADNLRPVAPGSIRDAQAKAWAAIEELERKERERLKEAACA